MTLSEVASEDPRFAEKDPPPLSDEFPEGSKIFFLGEHAYGVAAQVSSTSEKTLSVILAVCVSILIHWNVHLTPHRASFFCLTKQKMTSSKASFKIGFRPNIFRHSKSRRWSVCLGEPSARSLRASW
jgi:hypothetical protein